MRPPFRADIMFVVNDDDRRLADYIGTVLGQSQHWPSAAGYPDSLALCVIDAVWSLGVRYGTVINIVDRYRNLRELAGYDAASDNVTDLIAMYQQLGGVEGFAARVGNQQRVSTHPGARLKTEAVLLAAQALLAAGIDTTGDLRGVVADLPHPAHRHWIAVPGQGSGLSWRYLLMLAGAPGVKADRMIRRFVSQALQRQVTAGYAAECVESAAEILQVTAGALDHAIWSYQSGRWKPEHATDHQSSWMLLSSNPLRVTVDIDLQLAEDAARRLCTTNLEDTIHAALNAAASHSDPH